MNAFRYYLKRNHQIKIWASVNNKSLHIKRPQVIMLHDPLFNKEKIAGLYYIYEIDNQNYISLYIHNRFRQNGNYLKAYKKYGENLPVLTLSECKLESYLSYKRVPYLLIPDSLLLILMSLMLMVTFIITTKINQPKDQVFPILIT